MSLRTDAIEVKGRAEQVIARSIRALSRRGPGGIEIEEEAGERLVAALIEIARQRAQRHMPTAGA